ncbi:unnamed protein product [Caenorhabditis nigoni]
MYQCLEDFPQYGNRDGRRLVHQQHDDGPLHSEETLESLKTGAVHIAAYVTSYVHPLRGEHGPYNLSPSVQKPIAMYRETLADETEKTVRKAKRISLTAQADKKITFERGEAMMDEVLDEAQQRTVIEVPQQTTSSMQRRTRRPYDSPSISDEFLEMGALCRLDTVITGLIFFIRFL